MENVSITDFECLANDGNEFFIARIYRSKGEVDFDGLQNIINAQLGGFEEIHGYFFPCLKPKCRQSAAKQMEETFAALEDNELEIDKLWLDIQVHGGNWGDDKDHNRAFIKELIVEAEKRIEKVGIYTQNDSWKNIVGLDWNFAKNKYLWYPRFNRTPVSLPGL
uniref:Uncharacterized protein n=1 Tax=Panagrolaimus sp. ES5 TaxID=591445 RepID=A0AC34F7C4_9BILA